MKLLIDTLQRIQRLDSRSSSATYTFSSKSSTSGNDGFSCGRALQKDPRETESDRLMSTPYFAFALDGTSIKTLTT